MKNKITILITMLVFISIGAIHGETDKTTDRPMHSLYGIREETSLSVSADTHVINPGRVIYDLSTSTIPTFSTYPNTNVLSQVYYFDLSRKSNVTVSLRPSSVAIDTHVKLYKEGHSDNPFLSLTYTSTSSGAVMPYTYELDAGRYLLYFEMQRSSQSYAYSTIFFSITAGDSQEIPEEPSENCEGNGNLKFTYDTRGNRTKRQ